MKKVLILSNNSGGLYRFRKELMQKMIGISLIETSINRRGMNPVRDFGLLMTYFKMIKK